MAFKITDEQINGLVGKGHISTDLADRLAAKSGAARGKALIDTAKEADEELKAVPLQDDMVADKTASFVSGEGIPQEQPEEQPATQMGGSAGGVGSPVPEAPATPSSAGGPPVPPSTATPVQGPSASQPWLDGADLSNTPVTRADVANVPFINPNEQPPAAAPKPAPRVGGPGGIQLPKSEQMALAQARESGAVDSILQGQTNEINIKTAEERAAALQQGMVDQQAAYDKYQANREERYNNSLAELSELKRRSDEIANTKIDPDAHWSKGLFGSNTTANKLVAGIGILLGGFGQGASRNGGDKRGVRNMGLDALNKTIDDDIDAQKTNLMNRTNQMKQRESLYAKNLEIYKDADLADLATARQYWEKAGQQVQVIAAKSGSDMAKVEADKAMLGIGQKVAALDVQEQARKEQIARVQAANAYARSDDGRFEHALKTNPYLKNLPREQAMKLWKAGTVNDYEAGVKVAGSAGGAKSPNQDVEDATAAQATLEKLIEDQERDLRENGTAILSPSKAREREVRQNEIYQARANAMGTPNRTDGDRKGEVDLTNSVYGSEDALETLKKTSQDRIDLLRKSRGLPPITRRPKEQ